MKKLNRNNADIEKLRDKKVAVRLVGQDAEIDFRKWLEENGIHFNNKEVLIIRNGIRTETCYCVEGNSWDWCDKSWFVERGYNLYEWEVEEEEEKTYTIKDVVKNGRKIYRTTTNNCIYMYSSPYLYYKAIRKLSDDWRKTELTLGEIVKLKFIEYKPEPNKIKDAKPLTKEKKEILKSCLPQKTYTIKDVVENECKVYKCITDSNNGVLYKYIDDVLYVNYNRIEWKKSVVGLRKLLKYEFIEYKPEPKGITFEEALKEMETKVCKCLFSNRYITICGTQFADARNGEYTKLALPEIKGKWVVTKEVFEW